MSLRIYRRKCRAARVLLAAALLFLAAVALTARLPTVEAAGGGDSSDVRQGFCRSGSVHDGLLEDCQRLLSVKKRLDKDDILNWGRHVRVKHWDGVTLDRERTKVIGLYLRDLRLRGSIPPGLGRLQSLEWINLTHNQLTGRIPVRLDQLASLKSLRLSNNELTGKIPAELGNLKSLEELELAGNDLRGKIPNSLASLVNLQRFILHNNRLTGEIPAWLGGFEDLRFVWLTNNQLTGTLPPNLGSARSLQYLRVQNNRLTGKIPDSYGDREWRCLLLEGNDLEDTCLPRSLKGKVKTQDMRACPK